MCPQFRAQIASGVAKSTTSEWLNYGASEDTSGGPASAQIIWYRANRPSNPGEVWADDTGILTYAFTPILPITDASLFEAKWNYLSGNAPSATFSSAEDTWIPIATQSFDVTWYNPTGPNTIQGTVTASMRRVGTTSPVYTAIWDGEVILSGKGK